MKKPLESLKRCQNGNLACKKENLGAEASQQVGYATWQLDDFPDVGAVEDEKLELLLIMQMMGIDPPEKEKDRHTEKEGAYTTSHLQSVYTHQEFEN